jgi:hypothetical protein
MTSDDKVKTWDDLMALWPSIADFGEDAGSGTAKGEALKPNHVHALKARKNVPSTYWPGLIEGAKRRRIRGVTAELMLEIQQNMARENAA